MQQMTELISSHEELMNIAIIIGIVAIVFTVLGIILKTVRRFLAVIALLSYLGSAGVLMKAQNTFKEAIAPYVDQEEIVQYVDKIKEINWEDMKDCSIEEFVTKQK